MNVEEFTEKNVIYSDVSFFRPQQGPMGKIDRNGGAYFQELTKLNWLVLLPDMSPDPMGVLV